MSRTTPSVDQGAPDAPCSDGSQPRIGVVLERSLGHTTHAETLSQLLPLETGIRVDIAQIPFEVDGWPARVPGFNSNWTIRAGIRARRLVRAMRREGPLDALFVNTQVPAVLMPDRLRRIPTVVSLDATPQQFDELGAAYDHEVGSSRVERLKWRANRTCFRAAAHIVTWSEWAKQGVVTGYGIAPERITVIPPGVTAGMWRRESTSTDGAVHVLFVGGDLERKGGDELIEVVQALRAERAAGDPEVVLDLVTRADVPALPGLHVHRGLTPNSPALVSLFHRADVFALPTKADCLPLALLEGGAAGLPLVSTAVAGIPEIVVEGETGLVVAPGDRDGLARALRTLIDDPALRQRLGAAAAASVNERFDAATNTHRLAELLADVASDGRRAPAAG